MLTVADYDLILGALLAAIKDATTKYLHEQEKALRATWERVRAARDAAQANP